MTLANVLFIAGALCLGVAAAHAINSQRWVPIFESIKTVPAGAVLEYRAPGQPAQSLTINPGVYQISIKQLH